MRAIVHIVVATVEAEESQVEVPCICFCSDTVSAFVFAMATINNAADNSTSKAPQEYSNPETILQNNDNMTKQRQEYRTATVLENSKEPTEQQQYHRTVTIAPNDKNTAGQQE